jgi:hypothetical protein
MKPITFTQKQLSYMIYIDCDGRCWPLLAPRDGYVYVFEQKDDYVEVHLCVDRFTELEVIDSYVVYSSKF